MTLPAALCGGRPGKGALLAGRPRPEQRVHRVPRLSASCSLFRSRGESLSTPPPPPSTSNCCSAGIQTHPESRWSSGPASTSLRARGRTLRRCIVGRPHLFKRLLLNHQFKTLLLLSGGAGGEGMVIEASFYPPRQLGMVRIWCFNRLKVKQNTGRAGQDQST